MMLNSPDLPSLVQMTASPHMEVAVYSPVMVCYCQFVVEDYRPSHGCVGSRGVWQPANYM